jgi:hypothetical protein
MGEIEVERLKESRSMKLLGGRKSYSMEIATKPLVMASEISGLEPLHGFLRQENKVVPIHFQFARKHGRRPEFIERKMPEIAPRPSSPTPVVRAEQPSSSAAVQTTLPLFDATIPRINPLRNPKRRLCGTSPRGLSDLEACRRLGFGLGERN